MVRILFFQISFSDTKFSILSFKQRILPKKKIIMHVIILHDIVQLNCITVSLAEKCFPGNIFLIGERRRGRKSDQFQATLINSEKTILQISHIVIKYLCHDIKVIA